MRVALNAIAGWTHILRIDAPAGSPALRAVEVSLMHPTLVATPFHRDGWVYEEKYDGWRMVAYKDGSWR